MVSRISKQMSLPSDVTWDRRYRLVINQKIQVINQKMRHHYKMHVIAKKNAIYRKKKSNHRSKILTSFIGNGSQSQKKQIIDKKDCNVDNFTFHCTGRNRKNCNESRAL